MKKQRDKKLNLNSNPNVGFLHYKEKKKKNQHAIHKNNAYVGYIQHSKESESFLTMLLTKDNLLSNAFLRTCFIKKKHILEENKDEDYEVLDKIEKPILEWDILEKKKKKNV